jgi:hypothetical protein
VFTEIVDGDDDDDDDSGDEDDDGDDGEDDGDTIDATTLRGSLISFWSKESR